MLASFLLVALPVLADCPLLEIQPRDKEVNAEIRVFLDGGDPTAALLLPRGSYVWRTPLPVCGDQWTVQVLSVDPLYQDQRRPDPPAPFTFGCLDPLDASPVSGQSVILPDGAVVALQGNASCTVPSASVAFGRLEGVRPLRAPEGIASVKETYERLFGPLPTGEPRATDWGYVALPFVHALTPEERAARDISEKMDSPAQAERGVYQIGPGEPPYYVHFLGPDDPGSDIWGTPQLITTIMELATSWNAQCVATAAPAAKVKPDLVKQACTLQIGDLAWYNDTNPDPLGHNSHFRGRCADIRLFRSDGSWYEANWRRRDDRKGFSKGYSRELTRAFLAWATTHYSLEGVLFNDPWVRRRVPVVKKYRGHDDHIHLCVAR